MTGSSTNRTVSVSLDDRGQTAQDFAVGIGVFVLATAFVFAFVPTIITPFADSVGPESAQSERIAATLVANLSDDGTPNNISADDFETHYLGESSEDLDQKLGLRTIDGDTPIDRVNITIEELGPDPDYVTHKTTDENLTAGTNYQGESGASTTRIVTVHGTNINGCDPACKLVVRVW